MNDRRAPSPLEHVNAALELAVSLAVLYHLVTGEDPLELLRDAWGSLRRRLEAERSYRQAMEDTLEGIRDLPETEAPPRDT